MIDTTIKTISGRRHLKRRGFSSMTQAEAALPEAKSSFSEAVIASSSSSFDLLFGRWLLWYGGRVKITSLSNARVIMGKWVLSYFKGLSIKESFTSFRLMEWRSWVLSNYENKASVNRVFRWFRLLSEFSLDSSEIGNKELLAARMATDRVRDDSSAKASRTEWSEKDKIAFMATFGIKDAWGLFSNGPFTQAHA